MRIAIVAFIVAALALPGLADEGKKNRGPEEEIDYVALAARLVQDGHWDRAELTLQQVDETDEELDHKLFYVLRGLVSLQKKVYLDAADNFELAIKAGNTDPLVYINLGRARFGGKDYQGTVDALIAAGKSARAEPRAELLLSRSYWELGDPGAALEVLQRAGKRYPDKIEFPRLESFYLIKLELFQELARRRSELLERDDVEATDLAAISEALRKGGKLDEAKYTLEAARLRFPDDETLTVQLARVLMDQDQSLSSAMLLEQAARTNPKYLIEAAEMYRRAGRLVRALFINKRIGDQKSKIKQRLQILLELGQFEQISAMEARLSRLGLLSDQQIRYALAYGFFMIRDFESSEKHIAKLTDPEFFDKGVALRKAIGACKSAGWQCQ